MIDWLDLDQCFDTDHKSRKNKYRKSTEFKNFVCKHDVCSASLYRTDFGFNLNSGSEMGTFYFNLL